MTMWRSNRLSRYNKAEQMCCDSTVTYSNVRACYRVAGDSHPTQHNYYFKKQEVCARTKKVWQHKRLKFHLCRDASVPSVPETNTRGRLHLVRGRPWCLVALPIGPHLQVLMDDVWSGERKIESGQKDEGLSLGDGAVLSGNRSGLSNSLDFTSRSRLSLDRLQMVQFTAARFADWIQQHDLHHSQSIFFTLASLTFRIHLKVLVLTYRELHGQIAMYISNQSVQHWYRKKKPKGYPTMQKICSLCGHFKKKLKTNLFKQSFV